jgi:hypothetical protein
MRTAFFLVLALHGAIHVLGFLKWCGLAQVPQLRGRTLVALANSSAKGFGTLWLVAFVAFVAAACMNAFEKGPWWTVALAGVALSQVLVVIAWRDAKLGTLANVLIAVVAVSAAAHARFVRTIDREAREVLAQRIDPTDPIVTRAELEPLPAPVRRWLEASGVVGRERAHTVRLQQRGDLRTAPDAAWLPVRAEQYFSVDEPGFVWKVEATMHALPVTGRDRYFGGRGSMLIKAASLVDVANEADAKIDLGAMVRYLAEIVWLPTAALRPYITWEALDANGARATMRYGGAIVSANFAFDDAGRVTRVSAERYMGGGDGAKLAPWFATCAEYRAVRGIVIPVRGDVGWALATGEFVYYRWENLDVETNVPELYGTPLRLVP